MLAMGMMPRLSERAGVTWKVRAGGWTFLLIGILFGGAYYSIFHELNNRRDFVPGGIRKVRRSERGTR